VGTGVAAGVGLGVALGAGNDSTLGEGRDVGDGLGVPAGPRLGNAIEDTEPLSELAAFFVPGQLKRKPLSSQPAAAAAHSMSAAARA
jgi:hypothetical protein